MRISLLPPKLSIVVTEFSWHNRNIKYHQTHLYSPTKKTQKPPPTTKNQIQKALLPTVLPEGPSSVQSTTLRLDLRPALQESCVWYYKSCQKSTAREIICLLTPFSSSANSISTNALLNGHVVKLPSKYIDTLNSQCFRQAWKRSFFL